MSTSDSFWLEVCFCIKRSPGCMSAGYERRQRMIDRAKRAQGLRQLLSGRIDNLAFDELDLSDHITDSHDPALNEIFYSVWPHYDDFKSHALRLTDGQRLDFKRCVVF